MKRLKDNSFVNKSLFHPPAKPQYDHEAEGLVWLPLSCEKKMPFLFFPADTAKCVLVVVHGSYKDLGSAHEDLKRLRRATGSHVLAMEFPGYGLAPGSPTESSIDETLAQTVLFLEDVLRVPMDRMVFLAERIGTGPVLRFLARKAKGGFQAAAVVLRSPMTSVQKLGAHNHGAKSLLLTFSQRWDNEAEIPAIRCPVLFLHGECDVRVPVSQVRKLFAKCQAEVKDILIFEGSSEDKWDVAKEYLVPISAFLRDVSLEGCMPVDLSGYAVQAKERV